MDLYTCRLDGVWRLRPTERARQLLLLPPPPSAEGYSNSSQLPRATTHEVGGRGVGLHVFFMESAAWRLACGRACTEARDAV